MSLQLKVEKLNTQEWQKKCGCGKCLLWMGRTSVWKSEILILTKTVQIFIVYAVLQLTTILKLLAIGFPRNNPIVDISSAQFEY